MKSSSRVLRDPQKRGPRLKLGLACLCEFPSGSSATLDEQCRLSHRLLYCSPPRLPRALELTVLQPEQVLPPKPVQSENQIDDDACASGAIAQRLRSLPFRGVIAACWKVRESKQLSSLLACF